MAYFSDREIKENEAVGLPDTSRSCRHLQTFADFENPDTCESTDSERYVTVDTHFCLSAFFGAREPSCTCKRKGPSYE